MGYNCHGAKSCGYKKHFCWKWIVNDEIDHVPSSSEEIIGRRCLFQISQDKSIIELNRRRSAVAPISIPSWAASFRHRFVLFFKKWPKTIDSHCFCIKNVLKWANPNNSFVYFRSFQQQFNMKIVDLSKNRTPIVEVEGEHTDHLTTALSYYVRRSITDFNYCKANRHLFANLCYGRVIWLFGLGLQDRGR